MFGRCPVCKKDRALTRQQRGGTTAVLIIRSHRERSAVQDATEQQVDITKIERSPLCPGSQRPYSGEIVTLAGRVLPARADGPPAD